MNTKLCTVCGTTCSIEQFQPRKDTTKKHYYSYCKSCAKAKGQEWYRKNKEHATRKSAEYHIKNRIKARNKILKRIYNLLPEDYQQLLSAQNEACAICKKSFKDNKKHPSIDHCHTTGKIRGLLCDQCNTGLGLFKDNPHNLFAAINYLKKQLNNDTAIEQFNETY